MSGLGALLKDRVGKLVDERGEAAILSLAEKGRERSASIADSANRAARALAAKGSADLGAVVTRADVEKTMSALAKNAAPLARAGKLGLAYVVDALEDGDELEARRRYVEIEATLAERIAFQYASGDRTLGERAEREAAWAAVKEFFEEVGKVGLAVLGRVLRAAIAGA